MIDRMRRINCIHFVGIGGAGMSGIAEVLLNQGYSVQGSDIRESAVTKRLTRLGAKIMFGHDASNIDDADVVVVSSAIDDDNSEVRAALQHRCPVVQRAEMLAELMRFSRRSVAVAGTHGKTTATSLVASTLAEGGLDPTFVIGGRLKSADAHAKLGGGEYLVAEADESDASFMHLQPLLAIVTNVDADHLDTYGGDIARLRNSFVEFLHNLPFYGLAIICIDDDGARSLLNDISRAVQTYGLSDDADYRAHSVKYNAGGSEFRVSRPGRDGDLKISLNLPGAHNVRNALAAIAVAHEFDVDDKDIQSALTGFSGIDRRFQIHGDIATRSGQVLLIDDYGHHPTELAATIEAARNGWPDKRLLLVFQPHRYTRTRDLLDDFASVLSRVDALLLLDVYAAGEQPITNADSRALARAIRSRGAIEPVLIKDPARLALVLSDLLRDGDLLLTAGAGNIGAISAALPGELASHANGTAKGATQ